MAKKRKTFVLEKTRLIFLAIGLPGWLRERLSEAQREMSKQTSSSSPFLKGVEGRFPVVWELPEKLHITLAYLGRISRNKERQLMSILRRKCYEQEPFGINVGYLDYLYQRHGNGLVWVRVDGGKELVRWHKDLVKELNQHGFSISERKLVPHITLGRLKRMRNDEQKMTLDAVTESELPDLGTFTADEVVAICSRYRKDLNTTEFEEVGRVKFLIPNI